jgi:1-acyl-sn-glycerol-3-phosphate acyltransferase
VTSASFDDEYEEWIRIDSGFMDRLTRILTTWWWDHVYRLEVHGTDHVPSDGAFLLVPNHSSYADPFLQVRGIRRIVRFMTKSSVFDVPLVSHIVRAGGGFPIRRGEGDNFAMELARRLLLDGQPVVIYPEGTRYRTSAELGHPRRGAARLAIETNTVVIPVASWGAKHRSVYKRPRWRRPRVTTFYGEPIRVDDLPATPEGAAQARDRIWEQVQALYALARARDTERSPRRLARWRKP